MRAGFLFFVFCFVLNSPLSYCHDRSRFIHAESFLKNHRDKYFIKTIEKIKLSFNHRNLPDWMLLNIQQEFQEFNKFFPEDLDRYFFESAQTLVQFRIRNRQLYFRCNSQTEFNPAPVTEYAAVLYKILSQPGCQIETGDFLMDIADGASSRKAPYPILCFSKYHTSNCISIPDWFAIWEFKEKLMAQMDEVYVKSPWEARINKAFWIGGPNGGNFESNALWKINNRSQLVLFSLSQPDLLWARFTHIKHEDRICSDMKKLDNLLCSDRIPEVDNCTYKYLIDLDGFSSSFYRAQWILRAGSVLIKEDSGNVQWYFSGLNPYVHYIPYQTDCSDLATIIHWLRANDEKAKSIAVEGRKFALKYLNVDITYLYFYQVLKEYTKLNLAAQ